MASLRLNPSVHLGWMDEIGTIQRRLTSVSMKPMKKIGIVSASSLSLSNPRRALYEVAKNEDEKQKDKVIFSRYLDDWMNVSIVDIVKNLKQAPLLVHVYGNDDDGDGGDDERGKEGSRPGPRSRPWIKIERAMFENWPIMKHEWESGKTKSPDGLIFVEEIRDDDDEEEIGNQKSWGVMVKGKGIDQLGPACYLLKTSRVKAGRGMDLFCTHFCLVRVKNFRGSALKQFKSCWL